MAWGTQEDGPRISGDIPGTRRTLLWATTRFHVYLMMLLALGSAFVFIVGTATMAGSEEARARLDDVPEPVMQMMIGMICFSLFFPFFMALYFGRHFLRSVMRLEEEIARLRKLVGEQEGHAVPPGR